MDRKEQKKLYDAVYREKHKDKLKAKKLSPEQSKIYREKYKDKIIEYVNQTKDKQKQYREQHRAKQKEYMRIYMKEKRKLDPVFKLKSNINRTIHKALTRNGYSKNTRAYQILGCTFEELKAHLEQQFESWMTWDNYGLYNGVANYGWDIDHIEPLQPTGVVRFEDDIIKLNHYSNLRPLCSYYNRYTKSNKL